MNLGGAEVHSVTLAASLRDDIGKFGLPDVPMHKLFESLTSSERAEIAKYPARGQTALMALEHLDDAGLLIRRHATAEGQFPIPSAARSTPVSRPTGEGCG
jgi:response regulator RpfG family c-di-GMP phosphodiesterase